MKNSFVMVVITCSSKREAISISDSLLKKRLIACSNIIDKIESKFWWNGSINKAIETLVICKTIGNNFKAVEKEVKKLHSYKVPEIIALPIARLSKDYLHWIEDSVI